MSGPAGKDLVGLPEAAALLGVHYMTAYRYVRTGRLSATSVGGVWQIDRSDLQALARPAVASAAPPGVRRGRSGSRAVAAVRFEHRLVDGDAEGAFAVCETALGSWARPVDLYTAIVVPAMRSIGDRWEAGEITVADEHRATAVATRVLGRLGPRFARPGRRRGSVVVGAVSGDLHALPVAVVGDLLRAAGLRVIDLGANTPPDAFADAARRSDRLTAVAVGSTVTGTEAAVAASVAALHVAVPGVPVIVGGGGVPSAELGRQLGADLWSGPEGGTVVELVARLPVGA